MNKQLWKMNLVNQNQNNIKLNHKMNKLILQKNHKKIKTKKSLNLLIWIKVKTKNRKVKIQNKKRIMKRNNYKQK